MKKNSKIILLLSVVSIVVIIFLNMPLRPASITTQATLLTVTVTSDPSGCFVQLQNGVSDIMGVTHWTNWGSVTTDASTGIGVIQTSYQGGSFKIIVSKTDYPTKEFGVSIDSSGLTASVKAIIRPLYVLTVTTNPNPNYVAGRYVDGFTVALSLNGKWLSTKEVPTSGTVIFSELDVGIYKIDVWRGGSSKAVLMKTLTGNANVIMMLQELIPALRTLTINTVPTACDVTVVGTGSKTSTGGSATFSNLALGTYTVIISKTGYYTSTTGVTITDDRTVTVALQIIKYDLLVQTFPGGCTVTLSGVTKTSDEATGQVVFEELSPGTYALTVSKFQFNTLTQTITIGENSIINIALSPTEGAEGPIPPIQKQKPADYTLLFIFIAVIALIAILIYLMKKRKK